MNGRLRWASLIAVLALAVGGLVGAVVLPPLLPPSAEPLSGPRSVPVSQREFDDAHTIAAVPDLSAEVTVVLSGVGGMLTASTCTPGTVVKTGDHLLSVDGEVRIAIVSEVPLWRDLVSGTDGTDVEALQRALISLGHDVKASGTYDWDTIAAVEAVQAKAAVEETGDIALNQVQWVPAGIGAVTSCEAGVGTAIAAGEPLLKTGGTLKGLTLPASATELAGRSYSAVAGDVIVPIGAERRLTDPTLMSAVAATTAFADWVKDPTRGVAVGVRLEEPIAAIGIPPSAVLPSDATTGCVVTDDKRTVPVTILSSELGTVFAVAERKVSSVIVPASEVISSCG